MRSFVSSKLTETDALVVLNAVNGFGIKRIALLIEFFGSASEALLAPVDEFMEVVRLPQAARINFQHFSPERFLEKDRAACKHFGARVVTFLDDDYPQLLDSIEDRPVVLYAAGAIPGPSAGSVALVGSRRASLYGLRVAEKFAVDLAELGVCVVSGMARGIDTAAHKGALRAGGMTAGVLGCGLDVVYPPENRSLYCRVKEQGCLFSEFPFGTPPSALNFPRRNRIVSGLSLGVVVVEAALKSGALLTAGFALVQGREVFAVPGSIDSDVSGGPHALMKQGAKPVMCVADILEDLPVKVELRDGLSRQERGVFGRDGFSAEERAVLKLIENGEITYEELETGTGFGSTTLSAALLTLELSGKIIQRPGRIYRFSGR